MEGTATLADNLLEDLDDLSDVEETVEEEKQEEENGNSSADKNQSSSWNESQPQQGHALTKPTQKRLLDDHSLQNHLKAIRESDASKESTTATKKEQEEEEYHLIVQSNKHLAHLADELSRAHGDLCTAYKEKFPELEELLPNPVQYKNAVRVIANEMDMTKVNDGLNEFLNSNQIISISVAGSTTSGRPLTDEELQKVDESATYIEQTVQVQAELTTFVESRMEGLAPSVCALVGPSTAARLLGLAGGLAELSKIPACNLQVLGQIKQSAHGMSAISTKPHQGVLAECDLVQRCPKHLQKKALKAVAAKLALAARCDFVNVDTGRPRSAASGRQFRQEVETKIAKWEEPEKAQVLKALPKPDLTVKKRRGGKRMRRLKERYEETAMMKQANTRAFSAQSGEYGDDAMGLTMGLLDTTDVSAGGALRKTTEKRKMKFANTKASRKKAAQMAASSNTSGLASSVVFTPAQGMELVDPDAAKERVREANKKWFNDNAGFQSALPKK